MNAGYVVGSIAAGLFLGAWLPGRGCPAEFRIGQSYAEIKSGPCPDIDSVAFFKPDPEHTAYLCPSKHIAVVGSLVTGKMVAFMLWEPEN